MTSRRRAPRTSALSPAATLVRGYAVVQRARDGAVVRSPADAADGEALRLLLADGRLAARVVGGTAGSGAGRDGGTDDEAGTDDEGRGAGRG